MTQSREQIVARVTDALKGDAGRVAVRGARKVLTAAALTYVAAALASVMQLLYLLARTNRNRDE